VSNWIQTNPGKGWQLNDFERLK